MIVRSAHDSLQLITQPDHAHLAGAIMEHCIALSGQARRDSILRAIGEHDNGWTEEDATPALDARTGAVVDFISAALEVRHRVWPRAIARLAWDPWAAALVAQHAITVYGRFHSVPEWGRFFSDIGSLRDAMLSRSGLPLQELVANYRFVRLGDLISLTFCMGSGEEQTFDAWSVRLDGTRVVVRPELFGGAVIPIEISAKEMQQPSFRSQAELQSAFGRAKTVALRGQVGGT